MNVLELLESLGGSSLSDDPHELGPRVLSREVDVSA